MKLFMAAMAAAIASADESLTVYHMFEPKYTGLADRDAADYNGEISFIFLSFNKFEATNPEAAISDNVFEMSTVNVTGWSNVYAECNAPGCTGLFTCPAPPNMDYCCQVRHGSYTPNSTTLPGKEAAKDFGKTGRSDNGYWFSFPKESRGHTWTQTVQRRIKSSCIAEAWRADAGGCPDCQETASQCTADCIKAALIHDGDDSKLKATWDRIFSNKTLCPDEPLPSSTIVV